MTDTSITRLGRLDFTAPRPTARAAPVSSRARVEDQAIRTPDVYDEPVGAAPPPKPQPEREPAPFEDIAYTSQAAASEPAIPSEPAALPQPRFSLRKRIAVLIAAIAVPAMAAPSGMSAGLGAEPGAAPTEAETNAALTPGPAMPFEQAGMSFPGSAFYYVDHSAKDGLVALPSANPLDLGAEDGRELGALIDAGPAASGFFVAGSGISKARAQSCMAQAIWYEAGTESEAGQRAVAQVVLNRVAHPNWPSSVCGVVYEGSQRSTGCQFSFTCDGSLRRKTVGPSWERAQRIAADALSGQTYTPIGLATHYHTRWVDPYWASSLDHIGTIGAHRFYRLRGKAGEKTAFQGTYTGLEPSVSGRIPPSRSAAAPAGARSAASDFAPVAPRSVSPVGNRSVRPVLAAPTTVSVTPPRPGPAAPTPSSAQVADSALSRSGQVKEQYSNAGRWKKRPEEAATSSPAKRDE